MKKRVFSLDYFRHTKFVWDVPWSVWTLYVLRKRVGIHSNLIQHQYSWEIIFAFLLTCTCKSSKNKVEERKNKTKLGHIYTFSARFIFTMYRTTSTEKKKTVFMMVWPIQPASLPFMLIAPMNIIKILDLTVDLQARNELFYKSALRWVQKLSL